MQKYLFAALLVAFAAATYAQDASPSKPPVQTSAIDVPAIPTSVTFTSDAGFSYTYPSDWQLIDTKPITPAARLSAQDKSSSDLEKRAANCTKLDLLLRHGTPVSSIIVVVLPYSCVDNQLKESDLPGAAMGVSSGLKKNFDMTDSVYTAYKLGKYSFWAERSKGTSKAHPELSYLVEVSCGMLKSAMVCWMGFAKDHAAIEVFESGKTSIDGAPATPLVPDAAFSNASK